MSGVAHLSPDRLQALEPLAALSAERLQELAGCCRIETVPHGADPFRLQGLAGQVVYLLSGELRLSRADGTVDVIVGGCDAALRPLPESLAEAARACAITEVELLRIDAHLLDVMLTWDQLGQPDAGARQPAEAPDWRTLTGAFSVGTLTTGALSRLPSANIETLLRRFERSPRRAGEVVLREGDEGDSYYLIESGRCEVSRRIGGVDVTIAELKAGDAFGEEALVAGERRNATVTMRTDGVLLRLGKQDFIELLREPLLKRVSREEAERRAAAGAVWLDVRFPVEFRQDRLPGAINIPLREIRNAIGPLDPEREYIVYCQSGRRSSAAAFILSQHGYRAAWLEGGLQAASNQRSGSP